MKFEYVFVKLVKLSKLQYVYTYLIRFMLFQYGSTGPHSNLLGLLKKPLVTLKRVPVL